MKYKIGYIDEDPTQFNKYERELREYFDVVGYQISKGLPLEDMINQVYESDIDLLLVDYLLVEKGVLVPSYSIILPSEATSAVPAALNTAPLVFIK